MPFVGRNTNYKSFKRSTHEYKCWSNPWLKFICQQSSTLQPTSKHDSSAHLFPIAKILMQVITLHFTFQWQNLCLTGKCLVFHGDVTLFLKRIKFIDQYKVSLLTQWPVS